MPEKLICVAGARPNFMKIAPLVRALRADGRFVPVVVHTGQHYDDAMSGQFFRDLEIPEPDYSLRAESGSHARQTADILRSIEPILLDEAPAGVIVVGDVNSTVACALAAAKLQIRVTHVEAGLRSFDRRMPEEINRLATDAIADLLLVTEESGRRNLLAEGVPEQRMRVVGNLMIDTLRHNLARSAQSDVRERVGATGPYGVVTLHRPSNVDGPEQLREILAALGEVAREMPLYFPAHPRTRGVLRNAGVELPAGIHLLEPLGYLDFLRLMSGSAIVLTDSGGIQEETTALGIPCLTLRENTERPVTIELGTNTLAGARRDSILRAWAETKANPKKGRIPPLWDGQAALRSVEALREYYDGAGAQTPARA